jgi:hypothetical protein
MRDIKLTYYYSAPFEWTMKIEEFTGNWYITETEQTQTLHVECIFKGFFRNTHIFVNSDDIWWEKIYPVEKCNE